MANLNTQSFSSLLSNWATAVQGSASNLVDFTIGSILRAIDEAVAYVALWLQGLILQSAALARASSSNGADLDSWFADFGFSRLPAVAAVMQETFGRFTSTAQALVYPGATVQSQDGSVVFFVISDTANANWNAKLGAYVLPIGTASIAVTVQCTVAGSIGNANANSINSLATSISGVDYVNNASPAVSGIDAESDTAARARFVSWLNSLNEGTKTAVILAVESLQQGIVCEYVENYNYAGLPQTGYFYVIIDDGTGNPSGTLLSSAANAIEAVRANTIQYNVFAPQIVNASVGMLITSAAGYIHANDVAAVSNALTAFIDTLPLGTSLPYSLLAQIAYDASPGVINVSSVTLNGGTADLVATPKQVIKLNSLAVS